MENDLIRADCIESTEFPELAGKYRVYAVPKTVINEAAIESTEFPELAGKYRVYAVPKTVINEAAAFEGALPEGYFLDGILSALGPGSGAEAVS